MQLSDADVGYLENLGTRLIQQIGSGVVEIETPGVGRVQYATVDELVRAMNVLAALRTAANPRGRTFAVVTARGLFDSDCSCSGGHYR